MRQILLPALGAAAILGLATAAAAAAPPGPHDSRYEPTAPPSLHGPTPGEQAGMHTGLANTNGSSSVGYDRYGAHADGFPKIRLADDSGFEGRAWRRYHREDRAWNNQHRGS